MGCCSTRPREDKVPILYQNESEECLQIATAENHLKYSSVKAENIVAAYNKLVQEKTINADDLNKVLRELKVPLFNQAKPQMPSTKFYSQFSTGSKFDVQKLKVASILLAFGTASTKASIIFSIYDINNSASMSSSETDVMLSELFELSLSTAVLVQTEDSAKLTAYCTKLRGAITSATTDLKQRFGTSKVELKKDGFSNIMSYDQEVNKLVSSRGLRNLLLSNLSS